MRKPLYSRSLPKQKVLRFPFLILLICASFHVQSQPKKVIINSRDSVYEVMEAGGVCSYKNLGEFCTGFRETVFSSAIYKDIYYFNTMSSHELYSTKLGSPGSCQLLATFPNNTNMGTNYNSLTVDEKGIIYLAETYSRTFWRFNPYTKEKTMLGTLPVSPAGDLMFYGEKLLMSTNADGIYEINVANPGASTQYMRTGGYVFWALISFPFQCSKNKVYGFSPSDPFTTRLVELDLDNKTIVGEVCSLPFQVYDASSIVETGNTIGISIDSILINAPCNLNEQQGNAQVMAYSATLGNLTYELNTGAKNTDGKFSSLNLGNYQVKITNDVGCTKDTFFTITRGLSPDVRITTSDPQSCDLQNGSIAVQAFSPYQPVTIQLNNGPPQTGNVFNDLGAGIYNISVADQGNCKRDTSVILRYKKRPDFLGAITHSPTVCEAASGSIKIGLIGSPGSPGGPVGITASLNGGTPQSLLEFNKLHAGDYLVSIFSVGNCRYDTVVQVGKIFDPKPQISFQATSQFCFDNNGTITIQANGVGSPFQYSVNNGGFVSANRITQLAPGVHTLTVRNSNSCQWDSAFEIIAYPKHPVNISTSKVDPTCKEIESGELRVNVSGTEAPYYFRFNNRLYNAGDMVKSGPGNFSIPILNKDQCVVDSAKVSLDLVYEPECDRVSMPNAFSPNNDGNNDVFRPIHSPYVRNVVLTVYNRYGQVIYRSADGHSGWNGMLSGRSVDQGAYPYTLTYTIYSGEKKKLNGLVMLVR